MSVRELLQDRRIGLAVAGILIVAAAAIAVVSFKPGNSIPDMTKKYYSDDDGQSYFKDSAFNFAPWDRDGKTAVEATVYSEDGRNYVAYLQRYTPDALKRVKQIYDANPNDPNKVRGAIISIGAGGLEVKLPGPGHQWVPESRFATLNLQAPGPDPPTLVQP
jgi:hypothetical protein